MKRHFFVMKLLFDCICLKQNAQNDRMSRMVGGAGGVSELGFEDFQDCFYRPLIICLKQNLPDYRSRQAGAQNDRMSRMVGGGCGWLSELGFQDYFDGTKSLNH